MMMMRMMMNYKRTDNKKLCVNPTFRSQKCNDVYLVTRSPPIFMGSTTLTLTGIMVTNRDHPVCGRT